MENYTGEGILSQAISEAAAPDDLQPETADSNGSDWDAEIEQRISERAYQIYLERGGDGGDPTSDWLQAEAEIRGTSQGIDETEGLISVDGESPESYGASASGL
jgi:hypothetical protein